MVGRRLGKLGVPIGKLGLAGLEGLPLPTQMLLKRGLLFLKNLQAGLRLIATPCSRRRVGQRRLEGCLG